MTRKSTPWYGGGLRFACTRCGRCCTGHGYVWLSVERIERIAEYLGMTVDGFSRRYVRRVDGRLCLVDKASSDCVFWQNEAGCTIYEARPTQCRTFPFWSEYLESPAAWQELAGECPGAGSGPRHDESAILRQLRRG